MLRSVEDQRIEREIRLAAYQVVCQQAFDLRPMDEALIVGVGRSRRVGEQDPHPRAPSASG